jgi:hypothetical protein
MVVKLSDFLSTNFVPSTIDSADVLSIVRSNTIGIDSNTTGNYIAEITGGAGITVTGSGSHAATPSITFDSSMVVGVNATQTLTNKTINLSNNTLVGSLGQFNAALSGATFVSTDGAETLTNKILTSPTINTPSITAGSITDLTTFGLRDITTTAYETRIVSNNASPALSADRTLTLDVNNANRTVSLTGNLTLGGNFTTSGAHATTLTTSGTTALTLPTSGTLVSKDGSGNVTIAGTLTGDLDRSGNTTVSAGTYGSASLVPVLTVDASGFIDSIGSVSVAGVASLGFDSATHTFTINTADGGSFSEIVQTKMPGSSGSFGSASLVPIVTVNQYGLVDSISTVSVAGVSTFDFDSATGSLTIGTADGGSFAQVLTLDPYTGGVGVTVGSTTVSLDSATIGAFGTPMLEAIKARDGAASGLDADTLDGQQGTYYRIDVYDASGTLLN